MLEIKNVDVYGLRSSVIASGYAMREDVIDYDEESERYTSHFFRAERLAKAGGGSGHSNFRTGIIVQFDIKYTGFFSPESQRYHWWQIVTSMSKMHRIGRLDLKKCCHADVDDRVIAVANEYKDAYNSNPTNENLHKLLCNLPYGIELWERVTLNYEQLATIYKQRRHHRLEEWQIFCDWIETLPYSRELIICKNEEH